MILGHLDENSNQRYVVYDANEECPTLQSAMSTGGGQAPYVAVSEEQPKPKRIKWRIRKITPREAFRLMDFSDESFDKASAVCSNSQLYKQAGNSIIQNILVAALGQLFEGKEEVYKDRLEVRIEDVMAEPICLNSKGGRGGD